VSLAEPRSLVWATDLDVLPPDHTVTRRDGYLVIRSPGNPWHWWGNLLLFDDAPAAGDRERWEALFRRELGRDPAIRHLSFGWDRTDGGLGEAAAEFGDYVSERLVGLIAAPDELREHPRANREVEVRVLEPYGDGELWDAVLVLQSAEPPEHEEPAAFVEFLRHRQRDLRAMFSAGRGAWYVALANGGEIVGSCGIVVTGTRGRFQVVDTAAAHRRRGICSRLIVEAGRHAVRCFGAERLVIVADAAYHALGLYESLGFKRREQVCGVVRPPPASAPA
jgi:ribosomal protein S18 acetylase RimI-like enzyme